MTTVSSASANASAGRRPPAAPITPLTLVLLISGGLLISGCSAIDRLSKVGATPDLTPITNPKTAQGYQPLTMPMPEPIAATRQANSLWNPGSRAFFKDQRAHRVGDILTVLINVSDKASFSNETERTRENENNLDILGMFGMQANLPMWLTGAPTGEGLVDQDSDYTNKGTGTIDRSETLELKVAALITQVMPNGNMVLQGRQEILVNYEVRELQVSGIVRPMDITSTNTITYDKIAEARIAYGGRGHIMDVQQPRYGDQVLDILSPF